MYRERERDNVYTYVYSGGPAARGDDPGLRQLPPRLRGPLLVA